MPSIFACLHSYALHLQLYRNHVKEISGNFKDLVRVDLAVLKIIVIFWRFQNGSINFFWNYKQGKLVSNFLINGPKTCLYGLKISENIEIEHVFQFKAFFHITSNLHTSCFSAFKTLILLLYKVKQGVSYSQFVK